MGWSSSTHSMPFDGENKRGPFLVPKKKTDILGQDISNVYNSIILMSRCMGKPNNLHDCAKTKTQISCAVMQ